MDKDSNSAHDSANYERASKYPYLLAEHLNLSTPISLSNNTYTFVTSDSMTWSLVPKTTSISGHGTVPQHYTITIDVGNPKRQSCVYDSSSCKNPGQFKFKVMGDGSTVAIDNLTRAYLMNPNNLNDRDADLKKAKNL